MARSWNGCDLFKSVPELGMRLSFASLVPEFAAQVLASPFTDSSQPNYVTPLDDLKAWLRANPAGRSGLCEQVREGLLGQEERDRAAAAGKGEKFDLVDYELAQMESDVSFEQFDADWARMILELVLEEADGLQAWSLKENGANFCLSASFSLPHPKRHPSMDLAGIEAALKQFGAGDEILRRALLGRGKPIEFSGALQLELLPKGQAIAYPVSKSTGFVKVGLDDPRAGDSCDAALSLLYPLELEGYFLKSFDGLRKALTLKEEP